MYIHYLNMPGRNFPERIFPKAIFLLICLWTGIFQPCLAQTGQALPDSVRTIDSVSPSMDLDKQEAPPANSDTSAKTAATHADTPVLRRVPDSLVERLEKDKDFAYANDPSLWMQEEKVLQKSFFDRVFEWSGSGWMRLFLYLFFGAVLLVALYKIVVENRLFLFYSRPERLRVQVTGEENLPEEDLDARIREAILVPDYRTAIRYSFLKALRNAGEKRWIQKTATGTNEEYNRQMTGHAQARNFQMLTNVYEHVWYGKFLLTQRQFESVLRIFDQFYNYTGH